jgi:hypothetical protein
MARSRRPFVVLTSGVFRSVWACRMVSQFPSRTPLDFTPFTPCDAVRQFRRQQSVVGGFDRQFAHRRDSHIDGNGAKAAGLQYHAPRADGRLGEAGPWFLDKPRKEFIQAKVVDGLGNRGGDAVQDQGLQPAPVSRPVRQHHFVHLVLVNG